MRIIYGQYLPLNFGKCKSDFQCSPEALLMSFPLKANKNWLSGSLGTLKKALQKSITEKNLLACAMAESRYKG